MSRRRWHVVDGREIDRLNQESPDTRSATIGARCGEVVALQASLSKKSAIRKGHRYVCAMCWEAIRPQPPVCHYCGADCTFSPTSDHIYNGRDFGAVWECRPCKSYCGCHRGGDGRTPLGTPSNSEDRELRKQAHALFDSLWRRKMALGHSKGHARGLAYAWLAQELGIQPDACHIGMMHGDDLRRVIAVCEPHCRRHARL